MLSFLHCGILALRHFELLKETRLALVATGMHASRAACAFPAQLLQPCCL
jgi:hypothetical protein